jgi:hypothetical protein
MPDQMPSVPSHAEAEHSSRPARLVPDYPSHTEAVHYPLHAAASYYWPRTEAARRALQGGGHALAADLVFLEAWASHPPHDIAATLRAAQIRRANRGLAAEISAELRFGRPLNEAERAALAVE